MHRTFIQYLFRKNLHINIWDAESQVLYGFCRLPLKRLLRRGEDKLQATLELEILEPNFKRVKGYLVLALRNYGQIQHETYKPDNSNSADNNNSKGEEADANNGKPLNRFEAELQRQ